MLRSTRRWGGCDSIAMVLLSFRLCLYVCLSIPHSVFVSFSLGRHISLPFRFVLVSHCLSVSLPLRLCLSMSVTVLVCLFLSASLSLFVSLSIYLRLCLLSCFCFSCQSAFTSIIYLKYIPSTYHKRLETDFLSNGIPTYFTRYNYIYVHTRFIITVYSGRCP